MLLSLIVAFTKSPHQLTRIQSIRVTTDFPTKLAQASKRAGVPNGVLLHRLVDQYLESEGNDDEGLAAIAKLAEARERVHDLNRILGTGITIDQIADGVMSVDEARIIENPDDHAGSDPDGNDDDSSTDTVEGFWSSDHEGD